MTFFQLFYLVNCISHTLNYAGKVVDNIFVGAIGNHVTEMSFLGTLKFQLELYSNEKIK
jgi:hypothetical protein